MFIWTHDVLEWNSSIQFIFITFVDSYSLGLFLFNINYLIFLNYYFIVISYFYCWYDQTNLFYTAILLYIESNLLVYLNTWCFGMTLQQIYFMSRLLWITTKSYLFTTNWSHSWVYQRCVCVWDTPLRFIYHSHTHTLVYISTQHWLPIFSTKMTVCLFGSDYFMIRYKKAPSDSLSVWALEFEPRTLLWYFIWHRPHKQKLYVFIYKDNSYCWIWILCKI